jgi:hypothetical protein
MNKFCRDILLFLLALLPDVLKQEKISPDILKKMLVFEDAFNVFYFGVYLVAYETNMNIKCLIDKRDFKDEKSNSLQELACFYLYKND